MHPSIVWFHQAVFNSSPFTSWPTVQRSGGCAPIRHWWPVVWMLVTMREHMMVKIQQVLWTKRIVTIFYWQWLCEHIWEHIYWQSNPQFIIMQTNAPSHKQIGNKDSCPASTCVAGIWSYFWDQWNPPTAGTKPCFSIIYSLLLGNTTGTGFLLQYFLIGSWRTSEK